MKPAGETSAIGRSDRDLLVEYLEGDEQAFEQLATRYQGMVLGVCRRVTENAEYADDAAQATFMLLARRAKSLCDRSTIAGWLHVSAVHISKKAQRSSWRRKQREQIAVTSVQQTSVDRQQGLVLEEIDHALSLLPEKHRECLLLHYLEGIPRAELAERLDLKTSTLSMRLTRAREGLRRKLRKSGLPVTGGMVLAILSLPLRANASPAFASQAASIASQLQMSGLADVVGASPYAVSLTKGVVKAMLLKKTAVAAMFAFMIGTLVFAGVGKGNTNTQSVGNPGNRSSTVAKDTPSAEPKKDTASVQTTVSTDDQKQIASNGSAKASNGSVEFPRGASTHAMAAKDHSKKRNDEKSSPEWTPAYYTHAFSDDPQGEYMHLYGRAIPLAQVNPRKAKIRIFECFQNNKMKELDCTADVAALIEKGTNVRIVADFDPAPGTDQGKKVGRDASMKNKDEMPHRGIIDLFEVEDLKTESADQGEQPLAGKKKESYLNRAWHYREFDENKDGVISPIELFPNIHTDNLIRASRQGGGGWTVEQIIETMDQDSLFREKRMATKEIGRDSIARLDENGDGTVDDFEKRKAAKGLLERMEQKSLNKHLKTFDSDNDGRLKGEERTKAIKDLVDRIGRKVDSVKTK